jgi:hypothetical protein
MADCRISQNPRSVPRFLRHVDQSRDISHIQKQGTEMALPKKTYIQPPHNARLES